MGLSTSLFMCGCKVDSRKKKSNSTKQLIENGSLSAAKSNQFFPESKHTSIGRERKSEEHERDLRCKVYCCCGGEEDNNSIPWCQVMETQDSEDYTKVTPLEQNLQVGSMQITKPQFKALVVFSKNDEQCQAWQASLENQGFQYDLEAGEEQALLSFKKNQHHLVIIENQYKIIDAESLARSLRRTYIGSFTTIVAVTCRRNEVEEISTTRDLLYSGFDRILNSTTNVKELEDELLQLERGPLTLQLKFRSCQGVFTALERSRDLIQITDEKFEIQYVNKMYERITGSSSKHVMGTNLACYFENEKNEEDTWERIKEEIQSGKEWDGIVYMKRRVGEDLQSHVFVLPLTEQDGSMHQYVVVSQLPSNNSGVTDLSHLIGAKRKNSSDFHRRHSGVADQLQIRRASAASIFDGDTAHKRANSLAKIHSMAIEAPITQIINLISIIRDSSQPSVSEVLDQILDILRNSELYSPADLPNRTRDPMLSDFVEGLVTGTGFSHRRASGGTGENLPGKTPPGGGVSKSPSPGTQLSSVMNADPHIARCLENIDSWDYDVLALERVTSKKPLVHLGMHTLTQFNACEVLNCSPNTLHSWLLAIESNYHSSNPYHNSTHAADVLQATAYFLRKERVKTWMEPLDEIASLLAAIIHDVDHPGRTNAFLVNSHNPLALLYNDTAVLESHHAAFAFKFTVNSENSNIFKDMSTDNFRNLRQSIIDMVLATELSKHFEHVNKFISIVTKNSNNNSPAAEQDGTASPTNRASGPCNPGQTHELKILIKRVMIKVADVINPARKTPLCVEWARRISEEYFSQTDEEKKLGLPVVMPHFDRNACSLPKSQMTFIDYFLTDMFEAWHEFCGIQEIMYRLNKNVSYWQKLQDRGIMRLAELEDEPFSDDDDIDAAAVDAIPLASSGENHLQVRLENHLPSS